MTHTTEIWYHPDRTLIHFGSPAEHTYWREPQPPKSKKKSKNKGKTPRTHPQQVADAMLNGIKTDESREDGLIEQED